MWTPAWRHERPYRRIHGNRQALRLTAEPSRREQGHYAQRDHEGIHAHAPTGNTNNETPCEAGPKNSPDRTTKSGKPATLHYGKRTVTHRTAGQSHTSD